RTTRWCSSSTTTVPACRSRVTALRKYEYAAARAHHKDGHSVRADRRSGQMMSVLYTPRPWTPRGARPRPPAMGGSTSTVLEISDSHDVVRHTLCLRPVSECRDEVRRSRGRGSAGLFARLSSAGAMRGRLQRENL